MEQFAVIRFLTLKGLKPMDIQSEPEYVYEDGALEIEAENNRDNVSCRGESIFEMIQSPKDSPGSIFLAQSARYSKSDHSFLAKYYHDIERSPKIFVFGFYVKVCN
jgi:hypothetical protein